MTSKEIQEMIHQALSLKDTDIDAAKALMLTARTLFPLSFEMFVNKSNFHKFSYLFSSFIVISQIISFINLQEIASMQQIASVILSYTLKNLKFLMKLKFW
jgi:hypothetical protein